MIASISLPQSGLNFFRDRITSLLRLKDLVLVEWEAGWALGPVWTFWRKKNPNAPTGIGIPHRPPRSPLNRNISGTAKLRNSPKNQTSAPVRSLNAPNFASISSGDRLCGLVVRVSGYRYRGPGFDPRRYQIF